VSGYAYAGTHAGRPAYGWATEVSVYLDGAHRRAGGGRALYGALLPRLEARGFRVATACMTLPNDASVGLHRSLGFEHVGAFRGVGWKLGAWHDVAWMQRTLGPGGDVPPTPLR
jgi:phosphinothricin acetyltransferase